MGSFLASVYVFEEQRDMLCEVSRSKIHKSVARIFYLLSVFDTCFEVRDGNVWNVFRISFLSGL